MKVYDKLKLLAESGQSHIFPAPEPHKDAHNLRCAFQALRAHKELFPELLPCLTFQYKIMTAPQVIIATPRSTHYEIAPTDAAISRTYPEVLKVIEAIGTVMANPNLDVFTFPNLLSIDGTVEQMTIWGKKYGFRIEDTSGYITITRL